ncbi:MFS transporter [uncultured Jatrophihabitans sp.]|uniref:MFS transporter n=1 Tax=uncultured Jatrophihabitans sp. TaxID=1610747 RepID=UPI0035CC4E0A
MTNHGTRNADSAIGPTSARRVSNEPGELRALLIGVLIVVSLDTELLTVIPLLRNIEHEFHLSLTQGAWALSATGIAAGASIPLLTRLGDIYGLRRLLLITLAIVTIGNIICAVSTGPVMFIIGRSVVGVNAALPLYYAVLRAVSPSQQAIDRFVGVMTAAIGVAVSVSFLLGGIIVNAGGSARTTLWIIAGLSTLVLALVAVMVDEVPIRVVAAVDWLGGLLLAGGLALLVAGIGQGNAWGWKSGSVTSMLSGAVVLLAAWVVWEMRCRHPLIDLHTIFRRDMWPAFTVAALAFVNGVNSLLVISTFVQTPPVAGYGFGASVLKTTVYLLPASVMIAFGGRLVTPLVERWGERTMILVGGGIGAAVFLWFSMADWSKGEFVFFSFMLGAVYAVLCTAGITGYLRAARPGEQGMVTGAARSAASAIGAIGPALITALLTASFVPKTPIPEKHNYGHVWLMMFIVALLIIICGFFLRESKFDQRPTDDVIDTRLHEASS